MVYMLNVSITKTRKISYYDGTFEHFPCQYSQAFSSYVLGCFIWCIHIQNYYICLVNLSFHHHIFFFFALRSVLSDITIATLALSWIVFAHNVLFYFLKNCAHFLIFYFQSFCILMFGMCLLKHMQLQQTEYFCCKMQYK